MKSSFANHKSNAASFLPTGAFFLFAVTAMVLAMLWPRGSYLLVIGVPLSSPAAIMEIITKADGAFVQQGRMGWIAIAYSEKPDFATRLLSAGALLVLGSPLQGSCVVIENAANKNNKI